LLESFVTIAALVDIKGFTWLGRGQKDLKSLI